MEEKELNPEQLIVPVKYSSGNETLLKYVYRIFEMGYGYILPPSIITSSNFFSDEEIIKKGIKEEYRLIRKRSLDQPLFEDQDSIDTLINKINATNYLGKLDWIQEIDNAKIRGEIFVRIRNPNTYYLIHGIDEALAATLTNNSIHALELQSDSDLKILRDMVERGALIGDKFNEISLVKLIETFELHCISKDNITKISTLKDRVNILIANDDLPQYMKERYLRQKISETLLDLSVK